ncbi:MAG TPA: hypothetical protein VGY76_03485 [Solirubrobacteraceae bacterium]|nr:hypothetical protein [Solirubrobacteraceae bacterium]
MSARIWSATVLCAFACAALSATPAAAAVKLGSITSFGSFSQPNDLAVNQSSAGVIVADVSTEAVYVFARKSATEYEQVAQLPSAETPAHAFAFASGEPAPVAVNSVSGAVYVADIGHHVLDKFALTGPGEYKYECQITGFHAGCHPNLSGEEGTPEPHFGETAGVTVDALGNVYVSDYAHNEVDEFSSSGLDVGQISSPLTNEPANLAIDAANNLYLSRFNAQVNKLTINPATGTIEPGGEHANFSFQLGTRAVAVDPATGDVLVSDLSEILRFDPSGASLSPFSSPGLESEGVAANGTTHEIYISDKRSEDIHVLGPVTVPDVKTGAAIEVTDTGAHLTGEVNPLGTSAASYYFEYGQTRGYGATTPAPPGAPAGAGSTFTPVTPQPAEGLTPGTTYHYRLDATNNTGVVEEGPDRTFSTLPELPRVGPPSPSVSDITTDGAIFHGTISPGNGATTYRFVYGTSKADEHELPEIGIGGGFAEVEVTQASAVLEPGTTYHFVLVAHNASGTIRSEDQTFHTRPAPPAPTIRPSVGLGPAIGITQTGATLIGAVDPAGQPTIYIFEVGAAEGHYETRVFGSLTGEPGSMNVSLPLSSLQPGTIYHYRLVATNAAGSSTSPDLSFATALFPQSITIPPTPGLVPLPPEPPKPPTVKCQRGLVQKVGRCVRKRHHPAKKHKQAKKAKKNLR